MRFLGVLGVCAIIAQVVFVLVLENLVFVLVLEDLVFLLVLENWVFVPVLEISNIFSRARCSQKALSLGSWCCHPQRRPSSRPPATPA